MLQTATTAPGPPKGLPFLGNALESRGKDILDYWRGLHAAYGDVVKLKLGPIDAWSFAHPETIHQVLVTQHKAMTKGFGYAGLRMLLGEGLITTDAPHWASQRQKLNPLFTPAAIEDYAGAVYDAVAIGIEELEGPAGRGETIDAGAAMLRLTMRVVSRAAFGVDLGAGHDDIAEAFNVAFAFIADYSADPLHVPLFVPTAANRRYRRAIAVIERFVSGLIDQAIAAPGDNAMNGQIFAALNDNPRRLLRDEVISLYFAGFETTARTMVFLMHLLGERPLLRAELRAEAQNFVRPDGALSVLKQLPVATEIVSETLRLYPPVAMLARQPRADCEIGGYGVKANSLVVVIPFLAQRHKAFWPAGDQFAPEPQDPLPRRLTHKGAWMPFGGGPRICLGKHFAMVEMAIATALLCARFDWEIDGGGELELVFNGTIRPKHAVRARFLLPAQRAV